MFESGNSFPGEKQKHSDYREFEPDCFIIYLDLELKYIFCIPTGAEPFSYYVGVSGAYSVAVSNKTEFTRRALAYFLGDIVVNVTKDNCKAKEQDDYVSIFTHTPATTLAQHC